MSLFNDKITDLYKDFKPAYKNQYTVVFYDEEPVGSEAQGSTTSSNYFALHAIGVTFGEEKLELSRNNITKLFQIKDNSAYKRSDNLDITLREDELFTVKKFMEAWVGEIYDRNNDQYKSHESQWDPNIYKTVDIYLGDMNKPNCPSIRFKKVLPHNVPGFDMAWNTNATIISHKISLYVSKWSWNIPSTSTNDKTVSGTEGGN